MTLSLNSHAVGIILKELVRRAIVIIRSERAVFQHRAKEGYSGKMDDVLTSADIEAQDIYLKSLAECFPGVSVIAEEGGGALGTPSDTFFTVDPLDGTKAFVRRQSHGVGTMVALVDAGNVVSAYVGDVNTREIYGYRPGSTRVHRITEYETSEVLTLGAGPPAHQYVLLRDPPEIYSGDAQKLLASFKSYQVEGGSIGTWMARLWKGEVAAALIPPGAETPWDSAPIIGISTVMGFAFYRPCGDPWERYQPLVLPDITSRAHDLLVVNPALAQSLRLSS